MIPEIICSHIKSLLAYEKYAEENLRIILKVLNIKGISENNS